MTYYANTQTDKEDPLYQVARLCYCPVNDVDNKTFLDVQSVGDTCGGKKVDRVYDTILMKKDEKTLYVLWTASWDEKYYRLYREFDVETKTLGEVHINRFKVGEIINDFSTSGIVNALYENEIGVKQLYSDIGIMQKVTSRMENGEMYYYTGAYSGDFNCIIKSKDFITWEYVSQPDFPNFSKWENAVYVHEDKCYYFVGQHDEIKYGFLTYYDLKENRWEKPVLIEDCQSRSDFIMYNGELYLFFAPNNREHIGVVRVDTEDVAKSEIVFVANMHTSCFYPFVQYNNKNTLCMSYTVDRKHNFNCEYMKEVNFTKEQIKDYFLSKGHEIAVHGANHRANGNLRPIEGIRDVLDCRLELETKCDSIIRGMAYPDSGITQMGNFGTYEMVKQYLIELDIAYSRTLGGDNNSFMLPADFHAWMPSAHHNNPKIIEFIDEFLELDISTKTYHAKRVPRLLYIWGHSFELDRNNNWDHMEDICKRLANNDEIWYATNIEIYDYVQAYKSLKYSADGHRIYNPTLFTIWLDVDGALYSVKSGEAICI